MMGQLDTQDSLFYRFSIEDHVPQSHQLRKIDWLLDFGPIRTELAALYSHTGRPSIDPELMLRMLLVGYLYGIRSERRLVEEVHLNLAYRWFCKLGLEGKVPNHSTFSKNRHGRFADGDIFRKLFEAVVERCVSWGFVGGSHAAVDGSVIAADANKTRRLMRTELEGEVAAPVRAYLDALEAEGKPKSTLPKYISTTDPEAAWCSKEGPGRFMYEANYLIATANNIIMDAEATPARFSEEARSARRMIERVEKRQDYQPDVLAADKGYGSGEFLAFLTNRKIDPHIPVIDRTKQTNAMGMEFFE